MSRFTNDIDNIQMALEQSLVQLDFERDLTFVGSVVMMFVLSPMLFVVTFADAGVDVLHLGQNRRDEPPVTSRRSRTSWAA